MEREIPYPGPTSSAYWWRILRRWLVILLALSVLKGCSFLLYRLDGARLVAGGEKEDLLQRRAYLARKVIIDDDPLGIFAYSLPDQFKGEWQIGTQSMTAAAIANLAVLYPETRADAVRLLGILVERVEAPEARRFDTNRWAEDALRSLNGPRGHIGYLGHYLFVLGAYRLTGGGPQHDDRMREVAAALARRLAESQTGLLETYPGEIYIPDNTVVLAALKNVDRALGTDHGAVVHSWIDTARKRYMDPQTGLLVFAVHGDGTVAQSARGSGAGWNSFFLQFADAELAAEQTRNIVANLIEPRLGGFIVGVREFPRGARGSGDIDSGPVVWGLSTSGTGFAIAGLRQAREAMLLTGILRTAEIAGTTVVISGERRYLFAPLVGDAIMTAMLSATEWEPIVRRY